MTNTIYKLEMSELKGKKTNVLCEMYGVSPKALLKVINKDKFFYSEYREYFIEAIERTIKINHSYDIFEDGDRKIIIRINTCPLILED